MTNKISFAIAIIVIAVMAWASKAHATTIVTELSATEAELLKSASVFRYTVQAGGQAGANSNEVFLSTTSLLPDISADIVHSFPETVVLQDDGSGNLVAAVGSSPTFELPIVGGYNALLIQVHNWNTWIDGVRFESITINGTPIRNLFAQGFQFVATDQILVTIPSGGFSLVGSLTLPIDEMSGTKDRVDIWGVTVIPEPSTLILICLSAGTLFIRNRRS